MPSVISPATGNLIHHNDCIYCKNNLILEGDRKKRTYRAEFCKLTKLPIPKQLEGWRWCEHYQQVGCECAKCVSDVNQMANNLDKLEVL